MTSAPRTVSPSVNGWQSEYLDAQYAQYKADPNSVPADMRAMFQGFDLALAGGAGAPMVGEASPFQSAVDELVTAYREVGHIAARLDPFGRQTEPRPVTLSLEVHGLTQADLSRNVDAEKLGIEGSVRTLGDVIAHMEKTYCGTVGIEFMHIQDAGERRWFLSRWEGTGGNTAHSRETQLAILDQLTRAEMFERFLQKRYQGEKRFSLEGGETLIPVMNAMVDALGAHGADEVVFGMAHRGRLNVLNNVMGKTYEQIFTEFEDNWEAGFADGGGDVKYHRGYSGDHLTPSGKNLHLTMASNPSHLESVAAIVCGRARGKQRLRGDKARKLTVPVVLHGDAAVAGQGVVAELLNMSRLEGYTCGGLIHIVINNLIGFTTLPQDARSTRYCTDVGKMIDAPIFHVNGEDPEACVTVARLAAEYRQQFGKDVFIDLVCYRKYGHNEQDEQSFTQPILAALIREQKGVLHNYAARLKASGVIDDARFDAVQAQIDKALEQAQQSAKSKAVVPTITPGGERWKGLTHAFSFDPGETGVPMSMLEEACAALGRVPAGFTVNPKLQALLKARSELCRPAPGSTQPGSAMISYADAETLAFGTLLLEGHPVRLSGQDCRRGTFSHRHAVVRDFTTGEPYTPLNKMREVGEYGTPTPPGSLGSDGKMRQARLCVYDSPLSEESVLGFDYGYSMSDPGMMVCWEAQFGDFVNGAQVMIDQYIVSSELKWGRWSGLVMLLPHGYEGAGPEHSSARLERFLELCGDENIQVINPTTAAQIFHALRRQLKRNFRKPLIVMTPKSLLREPTSKLAELIDGRFQELIDDPAFGKGSGEWAADIKNVKRVIHCSGKVYFDLAKRRAELARRDIAIVRVEQLYPFHAKLAKEILARYPKNAEHVWAQEEPRNAGAFLFISDVYRTELGIELKYIGRDPSASPAVGSKRAHKHQQEDILEAAVGPKPKETGKDDKKDAGKPGVNGAVPEGKPAGKAKAAR
jgi:2-oxoglutarate dehydrogenase E1 component